MKALRSWFVRLRADPGFALLLIAIASTIAIYASTIARGLVNYDDTALIRDNWLVQDPSWSAVKTVLFDLDAHRRFVSAPEYLPVRDLAVMLDVAIWGDWYGGHHLTNLLLYLAAIVAWFRALEAFGIERTTAGLAVLLWALHPSHAESVAWLSERKGLLGALFCGIATLAFARFRVGRSSRWLVLAAGMALCAVWSKAIAAFGIAAIAGLEVVLPASRASWRRSLTGLAVIATVGVVAFIPVLSIATSASVVGTDVATPSGRIELVLGTLGFYTRLGAMLVPNAISYPIATDGPQWFDLALGVVALAALIAAIALPRRISPPVRAAAVLVIVTWIPVSHLVLPLQMVLVADRYLLLPSLGLALAAAHALRLVANPRYRTLLIATIALAAGLRSLDAAGNWQHSTLLWERAVSSNPRDADACSFYAQAVIDIGRADDAIAIVDDCLEQATSPRLVLRKAMLLVAQHRHADAIALLETIATAAYPRAINDLALLLDKEKRTTEALHRAREVGRVAPGYAIGQRTHGKIALGQGHAEEARVAFQRALELDPRDPTNRFNLGLALLATGRAAEAYGHFVACSNAPDIGARCRAMLRPRAASPR